MVDSEFSSVSAAVFVSGVGRAGVISASMELDKGCVGPSNIGAVGNGSSAIEADVGSPPTSDDESVNPWVVMIWGISEGVLVATSSKGELVGAGSLEVISGDERVEETSIPSEVVMAALCGSTELINVSVDEEAMAEVESGRSASIVAVGPLVSVFIKPSPPKTADRLSITSGGAVVLGIWSAVPPNILVSLPKNAELNTVSTSAVARVSTVGEADGRASEIESTSLSTGWEITVSVGLLSAAGNVTAVASRPVLPALVVKSEPTVTSTAVIEAEIIKDGSGMSSPIGRSLPAEGNEADTETDKAGISESRLVGAAPTLIPVGTVLSWLIVRSVSAEIEADTSSVVMSTVIPVILGRSVAEVAWADGITKRSLVAVGIISDMARDTSEAIEERSPGLTRSDTAGVSEGKALGSSADSAKTLLGSKAPLIRLETLKSVEVGMAMDADTVTSIVRIDDLRLSLSPKTVLWGTDVIWAETSVISVGSVSEIGI
jgi:hypothetical protein